MKILLMSCCTLFVFSFELAGLPFLAEATHCFKGAEEILPWVAENVGRVAGESRRQGSGIEICSIGGGNKPEEDSLRFLRQQASGDFEVVTRIDAIQPSGLAGLMARARERNIHAGVPQSLGHRNLHRSDDPYFSVAIRHTPDGQTELHSVYKPRKGEAASVGDSKPVSIGLPLYLKLRRSGSVLSSGYSHDGRGYREHLTFDGKGTPLADRDLSVGMVQSSENSRVSATALFDAPTLKTDQSVVSALVSVSIKEPLIGGTSTTGAIVRGLSPSPTAAGANVAYLESNSPYLNVPSEVTFVERATTATFEVRSLRVDKPTEVTVRVVFEKQVKTYTTLLLPEAAVASVSVSSSRVIAGEPRAVGIVSLVRPATPEDVIVALSIDVSGDLQFPPTVTVPAGKKTALFELRGAGLLGPRPPIVRATSGGVTRLMVVRPSLTGPDVPDFPYCPFAPVKPDIATDGQRVYVESSVLPAVKQGTRVYLAGYRYNDAPPTATLPEGEGRERIYCGCQRMQVETVIDPDGVSLSQLYFVVPLDAPSGEYDVRFLSPDGNCPSGGIRAEGCPEGCVNSNLFVTPSYIVSTLDRMRIEANTEDPWNHPAEMAFTFASLSGTPIREGDSDVALVQFSGSYPGGAPGSGHLTHADHTDVEPRIPLYIGRESRMTGSEWQEECVSLPAAQEGPCNLTGSNYLAQGRFSDHFEFTFAGVEHDSSPSKWWGYIAGVGTAALGCYIGFQTGHPKVGCSLGASLGLATAVAVNEALENDDDYLGLVSQSFSYMPGGGFGWGSPLRQGPFQLNGSKEGGDIRVFFQNHRLGGPRILQYKVSLKSITILEGYEEADCEEPNEIFLHSRAHVYDGSSQLVSTTRFPPGVAILPLNTGDRENFGGTPQVLHQASYLPENAPESPILYIELGVWEVDSENDLMGIHSSTIFLADFLSSGQGEVVDEVTPGGYFVRRVKQQRDAYVHGFSGSDSHCYGSWAHGYLPYAEQGLVHIIYELDVTWLKSIALP